MSTGAETIERFYEAFSRRDGEAMAACYAPQARFRDPAFGRLTGTEAGDMWRMLTGRATDLTVSLVEHRADGDTGTANWVADYTFSTGRRVHNDVTASFTFAADGRFAEHDDVFSFWTWSRQALGPTGLLLGWTPLLQAQVRRQARGQLERFRAGAR